MTKRGRQAGAAMGGDADLAGRLRARLARVREHLRHELEGVRGSILVEAVTEGAVSWNRIAACDGQPTGLPGLRTNFAPGGVHPLVWPESVPTPLTFGSALDIVDADADALVAEMAADIRCVGEMIIPDPRIREAALARADVSGRWPWPWRLRAGCTLLHVFHAMAKWPPGEPWRLHEHPLAGSDAGATAPRGVDISAAVAAWPPEVSVLDVARWARDIINAKHRGLAPEEAPLWGDFLVETAEKMGMMQELFIPRGDGMLASLPANALALLFLAERHARQVTPARVRTFGVDVGRPTVSTVETFRGADPAVAWEGGKHEIRADDPDFPQTLTFRWDDGTETQLALPFNSPDDGPFLAIRNAYGDAAIRDLLVLYALAWLNGRKPGEWWWWPEEHLYFAGLQDTRDNRRDLVERLTRFSKTRLEARFRNGKPLIGPLFNIRMTDGTARLVALHDALYIGIRKANGSPGRHFWPVPFEMLRLPADGTAGSPHAAAWILGSIARTKMTSGNAPRISVGRLADRLAIRGHDQGRRRKDSRVASSLGRTLEGVQAAGFMTGYRVEGGTLLDHRAVIYPEMTAGAWPEWPAPSPHVPATGQELTEWLGAAELTSTQASALLSIPASTIRRLARWGIRPLPSDIRGALRRHLLLPP